jgi:RimJ/RimL family protein N-acetyltransferase
MIETPRLILRAIESDKDRAELASVNGDPRVGAWLAGTLDRAGSDAMADRINAHIAEHGFGFWAAELKAERRIIGLIGLVVVKPDALPLGPAVEMGWRLAPETWGTGLATEGAAAARDWGFANLDIDELIAFTARSNLASQAVMRKIGMRPDPSRDFDHPKLAEDHPLRAHVVYAIGR